MHLYSAIIQFEDGTHINHILKAPNALSIHDIASNEFGKKVVMTHSIIIAPDLEGEPTEDMLIEAKTWYRIHEYVGDVCI